MASPPLNDEDDRYPMKAIPRGVCVVINNQEFDETRSDPETGKEFPTYLTPIPGSAKDTDALVRTFTKLHFEVERYDNLSRKEMISELEKQAKSVQSIHDCFVCCILSHGDEGVVYSKDGWAVKIKDLTSLFKPDKCPQLTEKPKLFFIEACQGGATQQGYKKTRSSNVRAPPIPEQTGFLIPEDSDFFLGYATVPGFVACVDPTTGSRFTKHFTDCLEQYAHSEEISHIFYKVNERVAKEGESDNKQTASVFQTLHKKLYLLTQSAKPSAGVILESCTEGESGTPYIGSIIVDPTSSYVYMTDYENNSIKVASLQSGKLVSTVKLLGLKPWSAALDPKDGNTLFVTLFNECTISLIDVINKSKLRVRTPISVTKKYRGVCAALSSGGDVTLLVSCEKDKDCVASVDVITVDGKYLRTVVSGDTLLGLSSPLYLCLGNNKTHVFKRGERGFI